MKVKDELKSEVNPISTILSEVGMNSEATKEFRNLFGSTLFNYSKPISLLKTLVQQVCLNNDIALDFFAGSGALAQAVMDLNKEDGGNRKPIKQGMPPSPTLPKNAFAGRGKRYRERLTN